MQDLSKTLLLLITCGHFATAQNNGDLRLMHDVIREAERLEIYLDGEWGTFCATGFNSFTGDAACHQLGYEYSIDIRRAGNSTDHIPWQAIQLRFMLVSVSALNLALIVLCIFYTASQRVSINMWTLRVHTTVMSY